MALFTITSKKLIASNRLIAKIFGTVLKYWWLTAALIMSVISLFVQSVPILGQQILKIISLTLLLATVATVCDTLTDVYSLLRKDNIVTNCQICKLLTIGLWIIGIVFILHIQMENKSDVAFALIGSVLAWVFQDKIKGAVAFLHFRRHRLLNIGDWIKVPKLDVDGEVKKVTLNTVTLYNWDTTTSTIPINALQSEHFMNLQKMADGKTYGRRMLKSFTLDTGWIKPISEEEATLLRSGTHGITDFLPLDEIKAGALNAHLYRLYVYHWLMNNLHVCQQPRLLVRWMDQKDSGLTLEVYAFLIDSNFSAFEWQQSQVIEHIVSSLEWFGLRLYQSPSAYDVSNSNIRITGMPDNEEKEYKQ
ncbi:MAG: mechanosensitive ion channel [Bacteroidales bacterium]|nr:mechanosensitive ion channel [Bacteroidales bacterium]